MSSDDMKHVLETLHDAVLRSVDMQWGDGTVWLALLTASGPKQIVVEKVTRLECPKEHPWGPSVHLNEVRFVRELEGAPFRLEIEMQSGDVLVVIGSAIRAEL